MKPPIGRLGGGLTYPLPVTALTPRYGREGVVLTRCVNRLLFHFGVGVMHIPRANQVGGWD
jgi:hypothetical protein